MDKDIEFFRREYRIQKKLENIVNNRILERPKTKKWHLTAMYIILPFLMSVCILPYLTDFTLLIKILISVFLLILVIETHLRYCFILSIKYYQHYTDEKIRRRCKCIPSCSQYAIMSLKIIFPLIVAIIKIRKRLYQTCNGEEYKIDFPRKKMNKEYESSL